MNRTVCFCSSGQMAFSGEKFFQGSQFVLEFGKTVEGEGDTFLGGFPFTFVVFIINANIGVFFTLVLTQIEKDLLSRTFFHFRNGFTHSVFSRSSLIPVLRPKIHISILSEFLGAVHKTVPSSLLSRIPCPALVHESQISGRAYTRSWQNILFLIKITYHTPSPSYRAR